MHSNIVLLLFAEKINLVDEALASPQGIEKCKRLLTFSTNDDRAVKKIRKRKLITPHSVRLFY